MTPIFGMTLEELRNESLERFKFNFENILEKYNKPFDESDVIDLFSLEIIEDNGFLVNMPTHSIAPDIKENDFEIGLEEEFDEALFALQANSVYIDFDLALFRLIHDVQII